MMALLTFVGGLAALLATAHLLVESAGRLGRRLGLRPMVIGLTIVAAGTSAPELAVVARAVAADDAELAIGSVIGSNIANLLLVLGLTACLGCVRVDRRAARLDIPVMVAASLLFALAALDGALGRVDGALMVTGMGAFMAWTIRSSRLPHPAPQQSPAEHRRTERSQSPREVVGLVVGIVGLAIAARYVVSGAEGVGRVLGAPELLVGLTVVALGTSAPELVTTLLAALRGERDLAVGNAVGSNIFNILLVLGATGLLSSAPVAVAEDALQLDLPVLVATAIGCWLMVAWTHELARWHGALLVGSYVCYVAYLVMEASGAVSSLHPAAVLGAILVPLSVLAIAGVSHQRRGVSVSETKPISQ